MSRIGQKPIDIVAGVEVRVDGRQVIAKGAKSELTVDLPGAATGEAADVTLPHSYCQGVGCAYGDRFR